MEIKDKRDELFAKRKELLQKNLEEGVRQSDRLTLIRTILFLVFAVFLGIGLIRNRSLFFLILSGIFFFVFLVIVLIHTKKKSQIKEMEILLNIHLEHEARQVHDFSGIQDDGNDFCDSSHAFSGDLDLFGKASLFHLLNAGVTWHGRKMFAELLLAADKKDLRIEDIQKRQDAISELSEKLPFIEEFQCAAQISRQKAQDPEAFLSYAKGETETKPMVQKNELILSILLNIIFITSLSLFLLGFIQIYIPGIFFALQILLVIISYRRYQTLFESVEPFYKEASSYTSLFKIIEEADFSSASLKAIQKTFKGKDSSECASGRNRKLKSVFRAIHLRSQPLLSFMLNIFFLFDKYCLWFLDKWKKENGIWLEDYIKGLGDIEAWMSLSLIRMIYPNSCMPGFLEGKKAGFRAEQMGHPLIKADRQIRNHFALDNGTALITGSNMSGKTTLLRTVGINCVLAYAGTFCCADSLQLHIMRIGASMRITDNLDEGLSTFYTELLRIGNIIRSVYTEEPLLFLIDEIFRGTNSRDRTDGAEMVLQKLTKPLIIGLMSTHDYELCRMAEKEGLPVTNYHFTEFYDDQGIHFPYKLEPGISTTANAKYLMAMMGIV